jgi:superfamily II DNA or RNA helicase
MHTFRRVRPGARFGLYTGDTKQADADVLFASIQTLGRQAHLGQFARDAFDYVVVDEFHHAAASTYRKLIEHFTPGFLLGLTATPERSDGGDLLALCQENLVYRCDVDRGIRLGLLCPFHYFGVPDDVDYANIPWRSSRFDEKALTAAVATRARALNAFEQWKKHAGPGSRTIAFCVSQRHADFMAEFFREQGLRAASVHAGPTSAARAASLEALGAGHLDIVCAVDMFNEGVDLPGLDTVIMLRPTESRIVWLQQFGRGLRVADGKVRLTVVDYIGNHRMFLLKPQTLFNLEPGRAGIAAMLERYERGHLDLPPGCEVTYELGAIEILKALLPPSGQDEALRRYYEDFKLMHGVRPTASEAFHDGYKPRTARKRYGTWLSFVAAMGDLNPSQTDVLKEHGPWLDALETTAMTKSYKMLVLLAMLNADRFPGEVPIGELADRFRDLATRTAALREDFEADLDSQWALRRLIERNPVDAWVGGKGSGRSTAPASALAHRLRARREEAKLRRMT